jgi:hypothetical protein
MGLLDENTRRLGGQRISGQWRGCIQALAVLAVLAAVGLVAACGGGNNSAAAPAAGWQARWRPGPEALAAVNPTPRAR